MATVIPFGGPRSTFLAVTTGPETCEVASDPGVVKTDSVFGCRGIRASFKSRSMLGRGQAVRSVGRTLDR
jgi:hypothetical protein